MSRDVSDFAGEFVSGSGTAAYCDAITLASGLVANALEAADAPGLVDGYSLLKELADKPGSIPLPVSACRRPWRRPSASWRGTPLWSPTRVPGAPALPAHRCFPVR